MLGFIKACFREGSHMTNEKALKESSVGKLMVTLCLPVVMIMLV